MTSGTNRQVKPVVRSLAPTREAARLQTSIPAFMMCAGQGLPPTLCTDTAFFCVVLA